MEMINKLDIVNERINNIRFLIEACQKSIDFPEYTPPNKVPLDPAVEMARLTRILNALMSEKETLT